MTSAQVGRQEQEAHGNQVKVKREEQTLIQTGG